MPNRLYASLFFFAVILIFLGIWGCNRMSGDFDQNRTPTVQFVNVPRDSLTFNFAPTLYWRGYDPDGFVTAYQFYDDTSRAAQDSFATGRDNAWENYYRSIPASRWMTTERTDTTVYLRRKESEDSTQHVFWLRCVDNGGLVSPVVYHMYFRLNQKPYRPTIKWTLDQTLTTPLGDSLSEYIVPDTLFWGDTLTPVYPGVGFVWKSHDPDDRSLYKIPLRFRWMLINETTGDTISFKQQILNINGTDTVKSPQFEDTTLVDQDGYEADSPPWSGWSSSPQVFFYNLETGRYLFQVECRDDGRTKSDHPAIARFYAIRPTFEHQLLIVDEHQPRNATYGMIDPAYFARPAPAATRTTSSTFL